MIKLKKTVRINKITSMVLLIFKSLIYVYKMLGKIMTITSANDSRHRLGSKHFLDKAFDLRTFNLTYEELYVLSYELSRIKNMGLIQLEWKEKVKNKWVKYKCNFNDRTYFRICFALYKDCENENKVSHLHIEWS